MRRLRIVLASFLVLANIGFAQAAIIHVPGNYPTIQEGIDAAANGDTVLVADGTYTGVGNKDLDFRGKAITVKSENGAGSTIIDCEGVGRGFHFYSGETSESVVSGFTVKNGSAGGGNLIQIALNAQTGEKMADADAEKDVSRPGNDGDIAVEPGEIMELDIALENNSAKSLLSVTAVLKTDDTRVTGLIPVYTGVEITDWNTVNMAAAGIPVYYGTIHSSATKLLSFQFVKIKEDFTPLGDQIQFTLEIKSGANFVGSDEFHIKVGADLILDRIDVEDDLKPGGGPEDIDVRLRNMTASDIEDVEISIDPDSSDVDIDDDRVDFDQILANRTEEASFETEIDEDFAGYVQFTLKIKVDGDLVNIESFRHYFGMRTQYIAHWVVDDDDNDDVAEPGEEIELQIARWNPTNQEAEDVETVLDTSDPAINIDVDRDEGDYDDIPAYEVEEADREYEFTIASADVFAADPNFDTQGHTVEFTLSVEEDGETIGTEVFTMRIGGMIRYLRPEDYDELMDTVSDDADLGPNNNGNGMPEPGEIIEIDVALVNISDDDIEDVETELDSDDDVRLIVDKGDYGRIRDGERKSVKYLVEIYDDFEGDKITFELEIEGDVDNQNTNLGMDVFVIPVWKMESHSQSGEALEPVVSHSTIANDSSADGYGGAISCVNSSSPTVEYNIITGNSASSVGGGIYCGNNSSPIIVNNIIRGNLAGAGGGGIDCDDNSSPTMINNTISGNSAGASGGGISCRSSSLLTVRNTILWGNSPGEIFVDSGAGIDIAYSDIQGNWSGVGNINSNPRFADAPNDDYHLLDDSPCIGAGAITQNMPSPDFEGNVRPNPPGSNPDMGAYESRLPILLPTITDVTPSNSVQGVTGQEITITGTNFLDGANVSFSGDGITINSTTFVDATKLIANIGISPDAPVGVRDVTVTNPDQQTVTGKDMFRINIVEAQTVSIEVGQTVSKGSTFSAAINVEDVTDLAGFQLDILFDPGILETVQIEEGTLLSDVGSTYWSEPDIDNTTGMITGVACARTGAGGADGSDKIVIITFKAIDVGEGYVKLRNVMLSNSKGQSIPATSLDATVTVTQYPPWDVNKDGAVDIFDLVLVGQRFGEDIATPVEPNPDVNGDGTVNIFDFVLVGQHFGETLSPIAPVKDIWNVDPQYLSVLIRIYDIMENSLNSDPGFLNTKRLLHRIIANARVSRTEVFQNYPNPFNPETWIPFQLSEGSEVEISVYNSTGRLVRDLDLGFRNAGYYTSQENAARWDGRDECGEAAASGVYFYTIRAGKYTATRKMLLLK